TDGEAGMIFVDIDRASSQLEALIERVLAGEEVVIARDSQPVAKLVAVTSVEPQRRFGALKGELKVPDAVFEPLPRDELALWKQ
ncbi:MAG TPA: hypothetical protein VFS20_31115, partial [Longimicrobium sp.]|nr:hypothetical protein [Longimicrobium sp.]